jgi:hypothetical protein
MFGLQFAYRNGKDLLWNAASSMPAMFNAEERKALAATGQDMRYLDPSFARVQAACHMGDVEVLTTLLKRGAPVEEDGVDLLHYSGWTTPVFVVLLDHAGEISQERLDGALASFLQAGYHPDEVRMLWARGARADAHTIGAAVIYVENYGCDNLRLLVELGADMIQVDEWYGPVNPMERIVKIANTQNCRRGCCEALMTRVERRLVVDEMVPLFLQAGATFTRLTNVDWEELRDRVEEERDSDTDTEYSVPDRGEENW